MSALRVRWLGVLALLGLLAVLARLVQLQLVEGAAYARQAAARIRRIELIEAPRGRILDRHGRVLAEDVPAFELWADPSLADRILEDRQGAERLGRLLSEAGFPDALGSLAGQVRRWQARNRGRRLPVEGEPRRWLTGLPDSVVYWLTCRQDEYPGLSIERRQARRYPQGALAAHLVGTLGAFDGEDLTRLQEEGHDLGQLVARYGRAAVLLDEDLRETGYFADDAVGRRGIEQSAECELRGRPGVRVVSVDVVQGRRREESLIEPARAGRDVHLTIDLALQRAAEDALDYRRGAVVALDPATGEVLVLASHPGFDPNTLRGDYGRLLKDPGKPLINRAVRGEYPAGSIFKLVTASAALEAGLDPRAAITCDGALYEGTTRYGCDAVHGTVDLPRALEISCNVFFFHAGRRVGSRQLAARARAFGFGSSTGLSLGGEELGGAVPAGDPLNLAVGQGKLLVTPVQAACMVATLANGGRLVRPVLRPGRISPDAPPSAPVVGPEALAEIREGMRRVVLSGTGSHAGLGAYQVLGKTGTAQVGKRDEGGPSPHAWFVCYGPDAAPALAVAVLVEHGGAGGEVAAPIAAALFRAMAAGASAPDAVGEAPPVSAGGAS